MKGCPHLSWSNQLTCWGRQPYFTPCIWRVNMVNRSCSRSVFLSACLWTSQQQQSSCNFQLSFFPASENNEDSRPPHPILSFYLAYPSHSTISCPPGEQWPCTPVFTSGQSITAAHTYLSCSLCWTIALWPPVGFLRENGRWTQNFHTHSQYP